MKKIIKVFVLLACVAGFMSCGSTPSSDGAIEAEKVTVQNGIIIRGVTDNPEKLGKNSLLTLTTQVAKPVYFEFSNWAKIRITSDFLDELGLNNQLSNEQKYLLMSHLFDELPKNVSDSVVREVRLGKYFQSGTGDEKNLVIRVALLTPEEKGEIECEKVIVLFTNAVKIEDEIQRKTGQFINLNYNATVMAAYNKGLLTNIMRTSSSVLNAKDISKMSNAGLVMHAQALLADESLKNDVNAHNICTKIMNDTNEHPSIVMIAKLMEYEYRISKDDLAGAQELWLDILAFSKNVPGDMTESALEKTNGASLYLLKKLKGSDL